MERLVPPPSGWQPASAPLNLPAAQTLLPQAQRVICFQANRVTVRAELSIWVITLTSDLNQPPAGVDTPHRHLHGAHLLALVSRFHF